jgi:hypothetical protein
LYPIVKKQSDSLAAHNIRINSIVNSQPSSNKVYCYSKQINFKLTGASTIFTTEASRGRFICTKVTVHADTIVSLGTYGPEIYLGWTGTFYTDFISNGPLPNSGFYDYQWTDIALRTNNTLRKSAPASTPIVVNVIQASTATKYWGTIFVEGYYINEN